MRPLPRLIALLALAALLVGGQPAGAAGGTRLLLPVVHSPAMLVYESDRDSGLSIVEAQPDGGGQRTLSGPDTNSWNPVPSPDGRQIAFFSTRDGHNAAYVMARDGSGQRWLADCQICVRLVWSPDSRLLWLTTQDLREKPFGGSLATLRIEPGGGPPVTIPVDCQALMPDGSRCAYARWMADRRSEVMLRSPATAEPVRLAELPGSVEALAWSRNGTLLATVADQPDLLSLYVLGLDGRPARRLATGRSPRWSPATDEIAFVQEDSVTSRRSLAIISAQGGQARVLADGVWELLGWSLDGTQLAYSGVGEGALFLIKSAGGSPLPVPALRAVEALSWSPDSARLAASAMELNGHRRGVYVVERSGGEPRKLGAGDGPAWLPDGQGVVFAAPVLAPHRLYVQSPGETQGRAIAEGIWPDLGAGLVAYVRDGGLYTVRFDGTGERLLSGSLEVIAPPSWSPDDRQLAFAAKKGERASIYVTSRGGGDPRPVAGCDDWPCDRPLWSPDGASLLFTIMKPGVSCEHPNQYGGCYHIASVAAAGGERRDLATGVEPAWSPDGRQIAYFADGLYVSGADGSGARLVQPPGTVWYGLKQPAWSSDGRQLSVTQYGGGDRGPLTIQTRIVDAVSGEGLALIEDGFAARWWDGGIAYIYIERFALRSWTYKGFYDEYQKLCLVDEPGASCVPIPRGHGNVRMYDIAP